MNNTEMKLQVEVLSSLGKIYPDKLIGINTDEISAFSNEAVSFQLAYKKRTRDKSVSLIYVSVETTLPKEFLFEYRVDYVPVFSRPAESDVICNINSYQHPDLLYKRKLDAIIDNDGRWSDKFFERNEKNLLFAPADVWQGIWFTINENEIKLPSGEYDIKINFHDAFTSQIIESKVIKTKILKGELPNQTLIYTSWLHCDCIADIHNVEIFSDRFFEILESYLTLAAKTGMNMLLTPAFTPALDTPINKERLTAQLVKVIKEGNDYSFDFSLFKKFILFAKKCGIIYFEHSHFFTQWGAQATPKIIAMVDGETKRIFGWDVSSDSQEYKTFLKSYLTALKPVLKELDIEDKVFFHISDEPFEDNIENYSNAVEIVKSILPNAVLMDALSHYKVFVKSGITIPVACLHKDEIEKFIVGNVPFFAYYTGEVINENYPTRLITAYASQNRIIGIMLYKSGAKGFLHWGYNYYYGELSHGICMPQTRGDYFHGFEGSAYIVYPNYDGTAIPSQRQKVFYEGLNDYRALEKLEQLTDRKTVLNFIFDYFGEISFKYKAEEKVILDFRTALNNKIEELISNQV